MSASSGRTSRASFVSSGLPAEAILAGRASVDLKARNVAAAQPVAHVPAAPPAPAPRPRSFTAAHAAEFERAYRHSQIGTSTPALPRTYTPTSELVRAGSVRGKRSSSDGRPPSSLGLLSTHHLPAAHYDVALSQPTTTQPRQLGMTGSAPYARPALLSEKIPRPSIDHDALERLIQQADDYESSHSVLGMRLGTNDLVRASFPCVGPWLAHFYADDLAEGAAKLDVSHGVTERMHDDARTLWSAGKTPAMLTPISCLSTWLCWGGICIGGCIKRKRSPSAMLRTYCSVTQNPKLYAPTVSEASLDLSPHERAERAVLRQYA